MFEPNDNPVQLVKHLHKVPENKRIFPALLSEKYDGVFGFALPDGRIYSRAGNRCYSLQHFEQRIKDVMDRCSEYGLSKHVLIFEVYAYDWTFPKISGAFRRQKEQFADATLMIHDAVAYSNFMVGSSSTAFKYRTMVAKAFAQRIQGAEYVEQMLVYAEEEAYAHAENIIADGGEGVVLRDPDAGWKAGARNETCTKIKIEERAECLITGVQNGEGKNEDVACVVVEYNGHSQTVAGGTYADRKKWLKKPSLVTGKKAVVEYMCTTPDGKMREPRLKGIK